jgi:hypothetical protein
MVQQFKHFAFTVHSSHQRIGILSGVADSLYHPEDSDEEVPLNKPFFDSTCMDYLIYSVEKGSNTERYHLQGYVAFKRKKTFNGAMNALQTHCHIEKARGSPQQNLDYISKEQPPVIHGEMPTNVGQGQRSDILDFQKAVLNNEFKSWEEVMMSPDHCEIVAKRQRWARDLFNISRKRLRKSEGFNVNKKVIWIYGDTGTGKTRFVYENTDADDLYVYDPSSKWFDGYNGESVILVDDLAQQRYQKIDWWLRFLQGYPLNVEIKGGYTVLQDKTIYITSNIDHVTAFNGEFENHQKGIDRRITHIYKIEKGKPPVCEREPAEEIDDIDSDDQQTQ